MNRMMSVGRDQCAVYFIDVEIYVRKSVKNITNPLYSDTGLGLHVK